MKLRIQFDIMQINIPNTLFLSLLWILYLFNSLDRLVIQSHQTT